LVFSGLKAGNFYRKNKMDNKNAAGAVSRGSYAYNHLTGAGETT